MILGFLDSQWGKIKSHFFCQLSKLSVCHFFFLRSERMLLWYELPLEIHQNNDITRSVNVFLDALWWHFQLIFVICKLSCSYVKLKTSIHRGCFMISVEMLSCKWLICLFLLACLHSVVFFFLELRIDNWFLKKQAQSKLTTDVHVVNRCCANALATLKPFNPLVVTWDKNNYLWEAIDGKFWGTSLCILALEMCAENVLAQTPSVL